MVFVVISGMDENDNWILEKHQDLSGLKRRKGKCIVEVKDDVVETFKQDDKTIAFYHDNENNEIKFISSFEELENTILRVLDSDEKLWHSDTLAFRKTGNHHLLRFEDKDGDFDDDVEFDVTSLYYDTVFVGKTIVTKCVCYGCCREMKSPDEDYTLCEPFGWCDGCNCVFLCDACYESTELSQLREKHRSFCEKVAQLSGGGFHYGDSDDC